MKKVKISINSPVILGFFGICLVALILSFLTGGFTNILLFSVYRSSLISPFTYFRFIGHIFGHAGWAHFFGNMTLILVLGPLLEEKYGSVNIACVIFFTGLITGLVHFILFPHLQLLGASGVVFAFILLSSFVSMKKGEIPFTLILVTLIYIGGEVYNGIFVSDNVSNLTHILGGGVGAGCGYVMNKSKSV